MMIAQLSNFTALIYGRDLVKGKMSNFQAVIGGNFVFVDNNAYACCSESVFLHLDTYWQ